jgi:RNA polymerase sigma-70 factor (ECF subfamily)
MAAELGDSVAAALATLQERQKTALLLCHYQGLSNRQAAEILDVSVEALESLLARGRRRMRQLLSDS